MEKQRQEVRRQVKPIGNIPAVSSYDNVSNLMCSLVNTPKNFKGGQLSMFLDFWKEITSDPDILQIVRGSIIDFCDEFTQTNVPPPLIFKHSEMVEMDKIVNKLQNNGVIKQVSHCTDEFLSTVFLRPKKDGSFRLILNLKHLNLSVEYNHFKLDSIRTAMALITPNCYMASMDWKDAYYSVAIRSDYRKYLRFTWNDILYEFQCLVMGLAEAPRKFTKLAKPMWSTLRRQGFISVSYIDDALLLGDSWQDCFNNVSSTVQLADKLGFTVHPLKSELHPCQNVIFLGFHIDSVHMSITLTQARREKIKLSCDSLVRARKCTIRELARAVGQVVSTEPCFPHAPLFYRELELAKMEHLGRNQGRYDAHISLSEDTISLLQWWSDHVDSLIGPICTPNPMVYLRSDSSDFAWGGVVMSKSGRDLVPTSTTKGSWSEDEAKEHINVKELQAGFFTLQSFCDTMCNVHIKIELDNTTAISYINKMGGKIQRLSEIAQELWMWARDRDIWVSAVHLPGILNIEADAQSRDLSDENKEWKLNPSTFAKINDLWGPLEIDLFATRINCQLQRYISWLPDPDSCCTNAFLTSWDEFCYAFPPFSLLTRVLQKVEADSSEMVLVAPVWPTQPWFPRLLRLCVDFPRILPGNPQLLHLPQDPTRKHPLLPKMKLAAYRLSGNPSRGREFRRDQETLYFNPGDRPQQHSIGRISGSGLIIAQKRELIPFLAL